MEADLDTLVDLVLNEDDYGPFWNEQDGRVTTQEHKLIKVEDDNDCHNGAKS